MGRHWWLACAGGLVACTASALQAGAGPEALPSPPEALILERLQGLWEGEGTWLGAKGRGRLAITPVLEGRFTRLEYRVERTAGEAALRFAGDAYYAVSGGRLSGTWFDSEGNVHALQARASDGALEVDWGPPGEPRGRSTYRRLDAVQLEVVDEAKAKDGSFREFARMRYQRK
jgi:hypothetical protein